ncbi:MAG TPA: DNA-formamidopyrimidine glycosylase family protein [Actinomycetes bacterium]|nr:DNA-formamidopyrimidine glycosylase family protein [Actinomycetes bacterium]
MNVTYVGSSSWLSTKVPEGHTIHRLADDHAALFAGQRVQVTSPQGRFLAAQLLDGQVLTSVEAWGKHLLYGFGPIGWVHIHLGLFGKVWTHVGPQETPRQTVRLRLSTAESYFDLVGATRCALIDESERAKLLNRLGPDPLDPKAKGDEAWAKLSASNQPIGQLLMDQTVVAGIGNVYRAELLFRARLDPYRPGRQVTPDEWQGIWSDVRKLMRAGMRANRIVTTRPEHRERQTGRVRPSDATYVYRRAEQACRICGTVVIAEPLAGRRLYRCPTCQA